MVKRDFRSGFSVLDYKVTILLASLGGSLSPVRHISHFVTENGCFNFNGLHMAGSHCDGVLGH